MGELGDKLEGNVKETGGKVTGDKKTEWEGKAQKAKGKVEGAAREMNDKEPMVEDPTNEPIERDRNL